MTGSGAVTRRSPFRIRMRNGVPPGVLSVRRLEGDIFELSAASPATVTVDLGLLHVDRCDLEAKGVPVVIEQ